MRLHCSLVVALLAVNGLNPALAINPCTSDATELERNLDLEMGGSHGRRPVSLHDAMEALHVPSVSIALIADNRVAWAKAYGDATPNTRYQAASLSKTVAAVAALRLVQHGRLSLDADVNDALTSWKLPRNDLTQNHPVTLRGLLSMTAGIGVPGYLGYARGTPRANTVEILDGTPPATSMPVRVQHVPGSAYAYSGGSYQIVQLMIEDSTHASFADTVKALVFQPTGMFSSTYELTPASEIGEPVARGHDADGQQLPGGWREVPELAAGGLWSTPTDLARLLISLSHSYAGQRDTLLSQPLAEEMMTRNNVGPYGLGVVVAGSRRNLVIMRRGQNVGYQVYMLIYPNTGDGIVIMTGSNNGTTLATSLIRRAATFYAWPPLGPLMD